MHRLAAAFLPLGMLVACQSIARQSTATASDLPVFDCHAHFHDVVQAVLNPDEALRRSEAAGIKGMLLSSWPGDGTTQLYSRAPDRVVPGLAIYKDDSLANPHDRLIWMNDPTVPDLIEERIKKGDLPYKTIGEFHVFFDNGITPVMHRVAELAIQYGLVLHAHAHFGVIEKWLKTMGPKLKILWAHGGFVCGPICPGGSPWPEQNPTPDKIKVMLDTYPNLYVELSFRDSLGAPITILSGPNKGKLPQAWKDLILAHPDRVMLGTDPALIVRWDKMKEIVDEMRGWLSDLPPDVAKKVAYANAENLLR